MRRGERAASAGRAVAFVGGVFAAFVATAGVRAYAATPARSIPSPMPDGAELVRLMGPRALTAFAVPRPGANHGIGARVALAPGVRASDLGLAELAPGYARFRATPAGIVAFARAHPELRVEVTPPLHTLLDTATASVFANQAIAQGLDGTGVLVGVADTGLDVTHPDFRDAQGHTRVAWLLDLSSPPRGVHADLEKQFGTVDPATGSVVAGAVWSGAEIQAALDSGATGSLPRDEVGHGTLVTSCAAGNGSTGQSKYRGVAPGATIMLARITGPGTASIDTDDMLRGVAFLFGRADALGKPVVVNLSLGTDFGPHDGTLDWEQALASFVGPEHPGHALVASAGNSGSIAIADGPPVHQSVHVPPGTTMRVPIPTRGSKSGGVEVWVAMHAGADLKVGLEGPDGTWVDPVSAESSGGAMRGGASVGVYNGSSSAGSPVPARSHGAVVLWQGSWPAGVYQVTLEGSGTADLYLQADGDVAVPGPSAVGFAHGIREGTINLPATHPSIIGVGCTINKRSWRSIDGVAVGLSVPVLDAVGGADTPDDPGREPLDGEPCWFSSAGPTLTGAPKPEIMAPGAAIVGALSQQAAPSGVPVPGSIFGGECPQGEGSNCQIIDALHGVSFGTSFSSPIVAGAVAVLLQHDATLTQDLVLAALQGGAHRLRGVAPFSDQAGVGEVDVLGAIAAVDRLRDPLLALPTRTESWVTVAADEYLADGSTPLEAIFELRAARGGDGAGVTNGASASAAAPADGFAATRFAPYVRVDGAQIAGASLTVVRRGPGVWVAVIDLPPGLGGSSLTVGAAFDGAAIVDEKTVPIAVDAWSAAYPPTVRGGCAMAAPPGGTGGAGRHGAAALVTLAIATLFVRAARRHA